MGFGISLKKLRISRNLTQEDFSLVSSRTYISALERGLKNPTLDKVELLAEKLHVSPLVILALAYSNGNKSSAIEHIEEVKKELEKLSI